MSEESEKYTSGNAFLTPEEARIERSRIYRARYKARQKAKDEMMHQRLEETQRELEELRVEHVALVNQSYGLESLSSYSKTMLEILSVAAAKARSFGDRALEGVNSFRGWAKHHWVMLPTIPELLAGSAHSPSDDDMRWLLKNSNPKEFYAKHVVFIDRIRQILEETRRTPETEKHVELKVNFLISTWVRFNILMSKEYPDVLEEIVCTHQLKVLREQAALGQYVRPKMLQNGPAALAGCIRLTTKQVYRLEQHWKQFVDDIQAARSILGSYTSKIEASTEAITMGTGQYNPPSSKAAAESFLLATDVANASDDFLLREGRAFIKLYIGAIETLTPIQTAKILTNCSPLMAHLPDVCNMLFSRNPKDAIDNQTLPFIEFYNAQ